jgi:OOP family OmpA-OmpF porin
MPVNTMPVAHIIPHHTIVKFSRAFSAAGFAMLASTNPAVTLDFSLPESAVQTAQRTEVATLQPLPSGAFSGPSTQFLDAEGRVTHAAFSLTSTSLTPFQLIAPLRTQLEQNGYRVLFACADTVCGGFDFRYLLDLLPEPQMHIDLGNYQYLLAEHPDGDVAAIITSRARTAGFVHITQINPNDTGDALVIDPLTVGQPNAADNTLTNQPPKRRTNALTQELTTRGAFSLDDLAFKTGSSALGNGPFKSLQDLANYLAQTPDTRIVLVGHTDTQGGLDGNIALSRKRAASVRDRLVETYGVTAAQLSAQGIGYLSPRASNATKDGRDTNRRVEAVLASTP